MVTGICIKMFFCPNSFRLSYTKTMLYVVSVLKLLSLSLSNLSLCIRWCDNGNLVQKKISNFLLCTDMAFVQTFLGDLDFTLILLIMQLRYVLEFFFFLKEIHFDFSWYIMITNAKRTALIYYKRCHVKNYLLPTGPNKHKHVCWLCSI